MTLNLDQLVYERALDQPLLTRPPRGWLTSPTLLCNTNLEPDALWLQWPVAVLGVPQASMHLHVVWWVQQWTSELEWFPPPPVVETGPRAGAACGAVRTNHCDTRALTVQPNMHDGHAQRTNVIYVVNQPAGLADLWSPATLPFSF